MQRDNESAFAGIFNNHANKHVSVLPKDTILLHNAGVTRNVAEKRVIQLTDTTVKYDYFLQKSLIRISNISDDGKEIIKYILKPDNVFSELSPLDNEEYRHEIAVALKNCEVCFITDRNS